MTLEEFISECPQLKVNFTWKIDHGLIRGKHNVKDGVFCPLTAMILEKTGRDLPTLMYKKGIELLEMKLEECNTIVWASDDKNTSFKGLREQLLKVFGLM